MSNLNITFCTSVSTHRFGIDNDTRDNQNVSISLGSKASQLLLDTMWKNGMRPTGYVEAEMGVPSTGITINGRPASDYMSQSLIREGYYTVISYLARHNPEALALMGDLAEATKRDGFWLNHQCKRRGITPCKVLAPKVLQELGVTHVNVYPVALLQRRFDD